MSSVCLSVFNAMQPELIAQKLDIEIEGVLPLLSRWFAQIYFAQLCQSSKTFVRIIRC